MSEIHSAFNNDIMAKKLSNVFSQTFGLPVGWYEILEFSEKLDGDEISIGMLMGLNSKTRVRVKLYGKNTTNVLDWGLNIKPPSIFKDGDQVTYCLTGYIR